MTRTKIKPLRNMNTYKATGSDELSPRLLKELASSIAGPLTHLFQKYVDDSPVSSDGKEARVCPIHVYKKGDKFQPSSYRLISLTCVLSKYWSIL